ncbi:MAG: stage II sporulation protein R [Acetivibrionales bacterium]|jgi:stage II sporulation protein R
MSKVLLIIKQIGNSSRKMAFIKYGILIVIAAMAVTTVASLVYSNDVNKGLADNLIRLHVVANSDSLQDQQLKRDVRDAIISYMKNELEHSRAIDETNYIIRSNLINIKKLAEEEIAKQGKEFNVNVMLGSYPFPTKSYGDITLPAGNYQALKVVIGKGEGNNWWCVLFPPLCFVDATHGTVPDSVKEDLRMALTEEEYSIVTSANSDSDIPIKLRFKIVEFFQDSRIKFTGMISKIFKSSE